MNHAHEWGIFDVNLPETKRLNPPGSKYVKVRTKGTLENRKMLRERFKKFLQDPDLIVVEDYKVHGDDPKGRCYYCPKTDLHIGLNEKNEITKAYKVKGKLKEYLQSFSK